MKRNKANLPRNRTHSTGVWSLLEIHVSAPQRPGGQDATMMLLTSVGGPGYVPGALRNKSPPSSLAGKGWGTGLQPRTTIFHQCLTRATKTEMPTCPNVTHLTSPMFPDVTHFLFCHQCQWPLHKCSFQKGTHYENQKFQ